MKIHAINISNCIAMALLCAVSSTKAFVISHNQEPRYNISAPRQGAINVPPSEGIVPPSTVGKVKILIFAEKDNPLKAKKRYADMLYAQKVSSVTVRALTLAGDLVACAAGNPELVPVVNFAAKFIGKIINLSIQGLSVSGYYGLSKGKRWDWNWKDFANDRCKGCGQFTPDTAFVIVTDDSDKFIGSFYMAIGAGVGISVQEGGAWGSKNKVAIITDKDPSTSH